MSKLKLFQSQKDDEDEIKFSGPCFQVDSRAELKEYPASGDEYLLKVIEERKKFPFLLEYKEYNQEDENKNQTRNIEEIPVAKAPDKLKPTIEWQNIQVADFSENRMKVDRMRTHPDAIVIPFEYDYCSRGWRTFFKSHEPALSRVIGLKILELDYGLEILSRLLSEVKHGDTIDHDIGKWIFTFMACLKLPLLAETHGLLRDIARQCADIRSHIDPENEDAAELARPLNLFICLVGRYFRQYDLAD